MSYDKQTWQRGDVITANKLNHMEDGIATGGGVLVVNRIVDGQTTRLDHTWQEIHDAPIAVMSLENGTYKTLYMVEETGVEDGDYWLNVVALNDIANPVEFDAETADGYPSEKQG